MFIFGGSTSACTICVGGDIQSAGTACNPAAAGACLGGGRCTLTDPCLLNDAWLYNILSHQFSELLPCTEKTSGTCSAASASPIFLPPPMEAHAAVLLHGADPTKRAALVWGGRTDARSACSSTSLELDCYPKTVYKLSLGTGFPAWERLSFLSEEHPVGRFGHTANLVNGSMLIYGGNEGMEVLSDIWL